MVTITNDKEATATDAIDAEENHQPTIDPTDLDAEETTDKADVVNPGEETNTTSSYCICGKYCRQ